MKPLLLYFLCFCLAVVLSFAVLSITFSLLLFNSMMVFGVADAQQMGNTLTEYWAYREVAWPILMILVYPVYFLIDKKFEFALFSTVVVATIYVYVVVPNGLTQNLGFLLGCIISIIVFVLFALSLPKHITNKARKKHELSSDNQD